MRKFIDIINGNGQSFDIDPLLEANRAYEEMMDACIRFLENIPLDYDRGDFLQVANNIKATAKWLGNGRNAATWFARYYRAVLLEVLGRHLQPHFNVMGGSDPAFDATQKKITGYIQKVIGEYERQTGHPLPTRDLNAGLGNVNAGINNFKEQMEHFRTVEYGPIQNYHFEHQTPFDATSELHALEELYNDRMNSSANRKMVPLDGDKIALKCKDGFAWWLLDRSSCTQEKEAMGHCGNTASPRTGQRILSLRQFLGKNEHGQEEWAPYLTFIWNPDGTLGERKGRGNHKPAPVFYPYIAQLFKQQWITGLVLGAHASDRDIKVEELPEAMQKDIIAHNPKMVPIKTRIEQGGITPEIAQEIADGVKKIGQDWYKLRGFTLESLTPEQKSQLFDYAPELMSEKDYYEKHGLDDKMFDIIHHGFKREGKGYINKLSFITPEDKAKIFDKHPEHMTERDYYERHGMDGHLMEVIAAETRKRMSGNSALSALNLSMSISTEDREKLYRNYPETQPLNQWYEKSGMSDSMMAYIATSIKEKGANAFWYANNDFKLKAIAQEDRFKLWDKYPVLMSLDDRYERHGLDDSLTHLILTELNAGSDSIRDFINRLKPTDQDNLYAAHPEAMRPSTHYERLGLTPELREIILAGIKKNSLRWFNDNYIWPAWNARGCTKPSWMDRHSTNNDATILSEQDTLTLFKDDPDLFVTTLPQVYYKVFGMDKRLKEYLSTHGNTQGWGHALGTHGSAVPIQTIEKKHLNSLFKSHPDLMLPRHYYERMGLTPEFLKWLGTRFEGGSSQDYYRAEKHDHQPEGMKWHQHPSGFNVREDLKKADLEKFFAAYPDEMTMQEHYDRKGLDKKMMKDLKEGFKASGYGFFFDQSFDPETDLKKKDLAALYRACPYMMPFQRQIGVLPTRTVAKNMIQFIGHLYDTSALGDYKWDAKNKRFIIAKYSTIRDFLEDWGDDTIQHYAKDDPFDHWHGFDGDVDSMDNILPAVVKLSIGKYTKAEYGQEPDEDDDDDVEYDDIDPLDWDEVKEALKDNGDSVHDALEIAASEGERIGAESAAYEAVNLAVRYANSELEWGAFDIPTEKDDNGKEYVPHDAEFVFYFPLAEMAKWLDTAVDGSDNSPDTTEMSDFIKSRLSLNSENFYGFDNDAALDRFYDECPEEALAGQQKNPFWEYQSVKKRGQWPRQVKVWKKLSPQQMRTAIESIFETGVGDRMLRWMKRDYDALDPKDVKGLKVLFERITKAFYG